MNNISDVHASVRIRIGSGFNQVSGSGYTRAKMTHKDSKKLKNFMFLSAGYSSRAEGQNPGSGSGLVFSLKYWIRIRNQ
jgi:hypothetical protein